MTLKEFKLIATRLKISLDYPTHRNVPASLVQPGDGTGTDYLQRTGAWTLSQHFAACELALANGATLDQVDAYCQSNLGMTFGFLYYFVDIYNNPLQA